jgi:cobalt-zinc-cadmium efflux system outer membrane protein
LPGNPAPITLAELEQIALGNNPTLAQATRRVHALRGKHVQSGLYPNPVIGYVGEEVGDEGRGGQQGAFFRQEIVTAEKLRLNRAVVSHEIAKAQQDLEIQRRRVINDVRAAAYELLVAQRTVKLDEQLVRIGDEGTKVAEQLLEAKEVSRADVLQARIEANSARLQLDNARNDHQSAWQKLALVIGVPGTEPAPLEDRLEETLPEWTWQESVSRLMADSPELARAYAEVERAQCALARECAGRVPNFEVEAGARYNNASEDTVATVRVAVPLQLFNRNQGNIQRAQGELAAARQNVRRAELSLQYRLADAFRQYVNALQQVRRYRDEILPDARESLDLVRQGYRQGEFGYLELLTAQRTYFRVNLAYVESLRTVWIGSTRIEGMLLTGGLDEPGQ